MTPGEILKKGEGYLTECGIPDASIDAWYLLEYLLKQAVGAHVNRAWFLLNRQEELPEKVWQEYEELIKKRGTHMPLQHITGEQEFMGIPFIVNDKVLIPRQDTGILVEEAMKKAKAGMRVLDLCTGSGCIIISLLKLMPGLTGMASDLSAEALKIAEENARRQGVTIDFRQGDLFEPVEGSFDLIVSNPPYIPTADIQGLMEEVRIYDPMMALDGREDGLYFYRRILQEGLKYLKPGGWLMVEIGSDQGKDVSELMERAGLSEISIVKDLAGLERVVKGRKMEIEKTVTGYQEEERCLIN